MLGASREHHQRARQTSDLHSIQSPFWPGRPVLALDNMVPLIAETTVGGCIAKLVQSFGIVEIKYDSRHVPCQPRRCLDDRPERAYLLDEAECSRACKPLGRATRDPVARPRCPGLLGGYARRIIAAALRRRASVRRALGPAVRLGAERLVFVKHVIAGLGRPAFVVAVRRARVFIGTAGVDPLSAVRVAGRDARLVRIEIRLDESGNGREPT
jgi:hypothetical protein